MRLRLAGFAAGAILLLASRTLWAQSDSEAVVLVSATRFPEEVRRLPASVTVLSAEDIAKSAARTLPELLREQTGLSMSDLYGNNAALTSIDLRGFGVTGPQNTLILLDGRRISDVDLSGVQWSAVPLASIERIEVLRGSGAVLYGEGASAGVVNVVTRSPLKQGKRLEAFGRAASFDTREAQLYGSTANNFFGINASLYGYQSDGYRDNNRNEQQNSALNLRWGIGENALDLRFGTDRQNLRLPGARTLQPSIGLNELATDPQGAQTPLDFADRDGNRAGVSYRHRVGEAELSLGLDWRGKDQRSYFDQSGFPIYRADALDLKSFTPRLRLPFVLGGRRHRLTLGADWHEWRYDSSRSDRPQNVSRPINRVRVGQDTRAFYVHDLIEVSAATQLQLGWREERVRYEARDTLDTGAPGFTFETQAPPAQETQRQRAWELGARHRLDERWTLFARVARSFRFVNVDEIYENDALFAAQFQILRPQHQRTRESGAEWRADRLALRGALFRTDVEDEIHLDPFSTGVGNTNLPPSRREGLELDARWQASHALRLGLGYAYTNARFREGVLPGNAFFGNNIDVAGRRVPLVPEHKLNLNAAWDMAPRTRLSGALIAVSSQFMDNDEPNTLGAKIPSFALLDLRLTRSFEWGRLSASVNNLLDKRYYTYAVRSAFTADRYSVYPLPGRTFGVTAELQLD